eukprot:PITA_06080
MNPGEYIEVNIGTSRDPKIVKIGKGTNVEERKKLTNLLREYQDVLAFSYDELKVYREDIMEHTIPLKDENAKPLHQKLRQINPNLAPLVQKELSKMLAAGIIAQTRHSTWCSNLVIVRKNNGTIRLCVDFQNLNLACNKDNYPLPNMETMLHRVTGSGMMSLLDGFSGYNQLSTYQLFTRKQKLVALPLQVVVVEASFQHWDLDFIGKFHENSSNGYSWILTTTNYFTKWVEAIPAKNAIEKVIMDFIENNIITRFGVPAKITTDNAKAFSSLEFSSFCFKYGIVLSHSSNYYPQGNGLVESSNKNPITIIKKIIGDNKWAWDSKIKYALWAYTITKKQATGKSPFELVYGLDVTLPVHLKLPSYQLLQHFSTNKDVVQNIIDQILELDEAHRTAFDSICKIEFNIKKSFDKSSRSRSLQVGDMVLLWDCKNEKPGKHKKFDNLWLGPYIIRDIVGPNSFHLRKLGGEPLDLPANGQILKLFFKYDI